MLRTAEELFGIALGELGAERGLSQEALALESGYHPTYIGQLERGKKSPSLRTIVSLSEVLGIYPSEIVQRYEKKAEKLLKPLPRREGK